MPPQCISGEQILFFFCISIHLEPSHHERVTTNRRGKSHPPKKKKKFGRIVVRTSNSLKELLVQEFCRRTCLLVLSCFAGFGQIFKKKIKA